MQLLRTEKGTVENDLCNRPPPIRRNVLGGCHEADGGVVDQNRNRTERRLDFVESARHLFGIPDVECHTDRGAAQRLARRDASRPMLLLPASDRNAGSEEHTTYIPNLMR